MDSLMVFKNFKPLDSRTALSIRKHLINKNQVNNSVKNIHGHTFSNNFLGVDFLELS